jgi:hypothetical protein
MRTEFRLKTGKEEPLGRPRCRLSDNIKTDFKEMWYEDVELFM